MAMVDVMKEMPITLMTRQFGRDTLAVRVFQLTSESLWDQAAWAGAGRTNCRAASSSAWRWRRARACCS